MDTAHAQPLDSSPDHLQVATFGGGCFWCIEAIFEQLPGVHHVTSGYAGGAMEAPSYQEVSSGQTGHAEVVQISFDPARVSYAKLLDVFWEAHDPTQLDRQGGDVGAQYRSVIFFHDEQQRRIAERSRAALDASARHDDLVVTAIEPAPTFYPAEGYHQDYYRLNQDAPYCRMVIEPKLKKVRASSTFPR